MRISKSKFVAGVQCLKRLYFQVHRLELATGSTEATEAVMEQGHQVGLVAQKAFPGGVLVAADHEHLDDAIRVTRKLVGKPEVPAVFEATFEYGGGVVWKKGFVGSRRAGVWVNEGKTLRGGETPHTHDARNPHRE